MHFQLIQFGLELLHRRRLVLVLRAVILALHHHAGRVVRDAHGRFSFVDVLTASAAGAVNIDAQIGGVDFNFKIIIHFRRHEHRGKRGMTAIAGIERRLAHQAVHPGFGAQTAEHIIAFKTDGGALDAGDLARRHFHQLGLEAVRLTPAQVHAQQHFRPVLRLGATGAGLNIEKGVAGVHFAGEHAAKFQFFNRFFRLGEIGFNAGNRVFVIFLDRHFQQFGGVGQRGFQVLDAENDFFQSYPILPQLLRAFRVVPDIGLLQFAIDFFQLFFAAVEVKDTPSATRCAGSDLQSWRLWG